MDLDAAEYLVDRIYLEIRKCPLAIQFTISQRRWSCLKNLTRSRNAGAADRSRWLGPGRGACKDLAVTGPMNERKGDDLHVRSALRGNLCVNCHSGRSLDGTDVAGSFFVYNHAVGCVVHVGCSWRRAQKDVVE